MIILKELEQGSDDWHKERRGKVTGTKLKKVMGTSDAKLSLVSELIAEEGTEQSGEMVSTEAMERGKAEEEFAIKMFEKQTGKKVERVGMCVSEEMPYLANSPDGLIADPATSKYTEAVESKSPNSSTAIKYKLMNLVDEKELGLTKAKKPFLGVPADYKWQVVDYFLVNPDLRTLFFLIHDERFIDGKAKLYIVEVKWENELLQEAIQEAKKALTDFRANWLSWKELVLPSNF